MNNSNEHQVSREKAMMDMAEEARQENISRNIRSQEVGTDAGMAPEPCERCDGLSSLSESVRALFDASWSKAELQHTCSLQPFGSSEGFAKIKAAAERYVEMQRSLMVEWLDSGESTFTAEEQHLIRSWMAKAVFAGC